MSLLSDTLAKVGSTALAREKTFTTTPTTNRQQRRAATVDKAIKRYNAAPEQVVVDNPTQNALETTIPFTDITVGVPFREQLFPDMVINKGTLEDWSKGELWLKQGLGTTAPDTPADKGVIISPHPFFEDTVEYGEGVTPDMQQEIDELLPEQGLGIIGIGEIEFPKLEFPDIFGSIGELGKYALLGLGALAVIMLMKK